MKLTIIHNPNEPHNNAVIHADNIDVALRQYFKIFPQGAVLYHTSYSEKNRIQDINKFIGNHAVRDQYQEFILEIEPQLTGFEIAAIVSLVFSVSLSLYVMFTMPKMKAQTAESSNNELANRANQNRLGGRIADIYGQVRSYPDLIAESYTYYNDEGVEIERQLLCVGRGYYQINDMKDAATIVNDIAGTSVSVYDPNTSIIGTPIFKSGRTFNDLPLEVIKSSSITGQNLESPEDAILDTNAVYFTNAGEIVRRNTSINFTNLDLSVGDSVILSGAELDFLTETITGQITINPQQQIIFTAPDIVDFESYGRIRLGTFNTQIKYWFELTGAQPTLINRSVSFAGDYNIASISRVASGSNYIYTANLSSPENVNGNWLDYSDPTTNNAAKTLNSSVVLSDNENDVNLDGTYEILAIAVDKLTLNVAGVSTWQEFGLNTQSQDIEITLEKLSTKWIGWHSIYQEQPEQVVFNVHFPQGLFRQNSKGGTSEDYTSFRIEWQYIDANGVPQGNIQTIDRRIYGKTRAAFGRTERIQLMPAYSGIRFRVSRSRKSIANNVSAAMSLKTVYLAKTATKSLYDDVTVIQSEAIGSDGLYQLKERKLNCLVTRKLPLNGTGELVSTKSGAQALIHAALDAHIGRRQLSEVDIQQILDVEQQVINYFGSSKAAEFSYTFDDANLSFEEISGMIASTIFCEDYRFGSKLRLKLDKPQTIPVMLFSEASKVPNSETRSKFYVTRAGFYGKGYDAVEIEYTSPDDDSRIHYIASDSAMPINPLKIKTSGIRTHEQAKTRAWREYNKLKYQTINVEFTALEESNLLSRNDLILVSNGTRIASDNGYVVDMQGNVLELSSAVKAGTYFIYVQLPNMSVDIIECTALSDGYEVVLSRAPTVALTIDDGLTSYQIVPQSNATPMPFLVTEINPADNYTNNVVATNYNVNYYSKDKQFWS